MIADASDYLIPLTVGITGHRDLAIDDEDAARAAVKRKLAALMDDWHPTPVRVLCGLAEGADMVAAEAALALGLEVTAVLPISAEEFAKDFESPADPGRNPGALADRFRTVLSKCREIWIASDDDHFAKDESLPKDDVDRYQRVGAYVVKRSLILIALWDGKSSDLPGGTAHVVGLMLQGVAQAGPKPLDIHDAGPVYHLSTPRGGAEIELPFRWSTLWPDDVKPRGAEARFNAALGRLRIFNIDALGELKDRREPIERAVATFESPIPWLSGSDRRMVRHFAICDAMAVRMRRAVVWTMRGYLLLGLLMAGFYGVFSDIGEPRKGMLEVYLICFGAAWLLYWVVKRREHYTRFLDYRCLAEGLRIQLYWRLYGVAADVSDHYLRKQRDELVWIRRALRSVNHGPTTRSLDLGLVSKLWMQDQGRYYKRTSDRYQKLSGFLNRLGLLLFAVGFITACGYWLVSEARPGLLCEPWRSLLIFLMGLAPALAAIAKGYDNKLGLAELGKQYRRMEESFSVALEALQRSADWKEIRDLLQAVGTEALTENGDWLLLHREREQASPVD